MTSAKILPTVEEIEAEVGKRSREIILYSNNMSKICGFLDMNVLYGRDGEMIYNSGEGWGEETLNE
ncbi:MAG: hypothetical protein QMD44_09850 [Thermodesulfovibrionales bacterium]|jgi:hypothetical protein|nr:hypothetical protein [Thermodesulfovibrionales bacterium]